MELLAQQLVNGLFIGSVYGLFAVGYTLVFGVLDILNLAHAAVFTMGGLVALWLVDTGGLSIWAGLPESPFCSAVCLACFSTGSPLRRCGSGPTPIFPG